MLLTVSTGQSVFLLWAHSSTLLLKVLLQLLQTWSQHH